MTRINSHYEKLKAGYLFPEIGRRVREFAVAHPEAKIIRLGIGDVVLPLPVSVRDAMKKAVDEMGSLQTFRGYGPEQGYDFLREAIAKQDYASRRTDIQADEIFISDGSKCDTGNIQEIFDLKSKIAVTDPVYPVYVDTNVMAGRTGKADKNGRYTGIVYLPTTAENGFRPSFPKQKVDLIYLCSPNNPTGAVMTHEDLVAWVRYAKKNNAVILFDAAYHAFITDSSLPQTIFEIPGARDVALEFRSFSKTAGFTGIRCAFTVVPKTLKVKNQSGKKIPLHSLWLRRQSTKFNGVSYPVQRGAEAVYSEKGKIEVQDLVRYYLKNASLILEGLKSAGLEAYGGVNAPYIWLKTPKNMKSWKFFDLLLSQTHVVGTPGAGFGPHGEGYFRLSAFAMRESVEEAVKRIKKL